MILAKIIKHILLRKKGIFLDDKSDINWGLQLGVGFKRAKIVDSKLEINSLGNGCFIIFANIMISSINQISRI